MLFTRVQHRVQHRVPPMLLKPRPAGGAAGPSRPGNPGRPPRGRASQQSSAAGPGTRSFRERRPLGGDREDAVSWRPPLASLPLALQPIAASQAQTRSARLAP